MLDAHTCVIYLRFAANITDVCRTSRWRSDVNSFPSLDPQIENGPTYVYEYSSREAYGASIDGWGLDDPLNATWWHRVTEGTAFPSPLSRSVANLSAPKKL